MNKLLKAGDFKTILFVLIVLALCELALRNFASDLSENIEHIKSFPQTAKYISESKTKSVLFIGNSLVGNAVNMDQFVGKMRTLNNGGVGGYKMVPDASSLWDWYCIVKNTFTEQSQYPEVIVNGFAWWALSDQERPEPSRLGGYFCSINDIPDLYESGLKDVGDIAEYIVASKSLFFVNRNHIKERVLNNIIFEYQPSIQLINKKTNYRKEALSQRKTYGLLRKYILLLKENGVTIVFVSMPVIDDYIVDDGLLNEMKRSGAEYLDFRHLEGITVEHYRDPIHLKADGSQIFTKKMISSFQENNWDI